MISGDSEGPRKPPRTRRGWDSNPRYRCRYTSFPGWPIQPLLHPSGSGGTGNATPLPAPSGARLWPRLRMSPGQIGFVSLADSLRWTLRKCCWNRCRMAVGQWGGSAKWPTLGCRLTAPRGAQRLPWGEQRYDVRGTERRGAGLETGVPSRRTVRLDGETRFAGLRPACRLQPAFQAVRVVRVDRGYDVRGAPVAM